MKLAFAGTPEFAQVALQHLQAAGLAPALVLTQPDRPAGRGLKLQPSAVKTLALQFGIAVAQPRGLRLDGRHADDADAARAALQALAPEVLVVAAYGLILPPWLLELPARGCINIHASLLPRWRGAAPIQRAIEAGDRATGISIMQMDAGLDTGAILAAEAIAIGADDTAASLQQRLAVLGGRMIVAALQAPAPAARPQPVDGVTYAAKISKDEAPIDWRHPATEIERRLRAFDPFPGATARLAGEIVKCWRGDVVAADGLPGQVLGADGLPGQLLAADHQGIVVACGTGALRLTELQRAGGRRLVAHEFLQRTPLQPGQRFDAS